MPDSTFPASAMNRTGSIRNGQIAGGSVANPGVSTIHVPGQKFYFINLSGPIRAMTDVTPADIFELGTGRSFPLEAQFKVLTLFNDSATPIQYTVFIGWGDYLDNRPFVERRTQSFGSGHASVLANSSLPFTGVPDLSKQQFQRRSLQVTNLDPAIYLYLQDSTGADVLGVNPLQSVILYDAGSLSVTNKTASAVSCVISETWYLTATG